MEVKSAAWATVALVITAFGAVVIYAIDREVSKTEVSKARTELSGQEGILTMRKRTLSERRETLLATQERVADIEAALVRIKEAEGKNAALQVIIETLRSDWSKTLVIFKKEVDAVRQRTRDEITPTMVLADGSELKSVHFKEIKATTVVLEHSAGIAKVPLANMPADWVGRLALGWNPKLPPALSGKPDEPEVVVEEAAPVKSIEMVQKEHRQSTNRADVSDAEGRIKSLQIKIGEAERAIAVQNRIAAEYDYKHNLALAKGNTSSHSVKRNEAMRAAAALQNQTTAARDQIQKLYEEIQRKSQ